jgi:histidine ammonia-lyase
MGPIAARDCLRILELSEQVAAAHTLATVQAIILRRRSAGAKEARYLNGVDGGLKLFIESVKNEFAFLEEDRALEPELRKFVDLIRGRHWSLYDR